MCGVAGVLSPNLKLNTLVLMSSTLSHRGPDDCGNWISEVHSVGLAHARLSIQDLSAAGHQPMHSKSQRFVMVFNGEIYNHIDLRKVLEKTQNINWSGHSDTETLLAGFETWGVEETIKKCTGMFAIALWDHELETLSLIRDRFGEKPLYYGWQKNTFMFASELKALKRHPDFESKINRQALNHYFRLNYIPTPLSIYENVFKLEPGCIAIFSAEGELISKNKYWSIEEVFLGVCKDHVKSEQNWVDELEILIQQSISDQKLSDVPLGAFLSGGIDSSLVVGVLQSISDQPVKTFTIGFDDSDFNEASDAKLVAEHLKTEHTELIVTAEQAMAVIEKLPTIYDEPFADASQIPTFLVSQLAKKYVTVCLSGDGGDELYCGYNRYHYTAKVWSKISRLPLFIRKGLSHALLAISPQTWNRLGRLLLIDKKIPNLGNKIQKGAHVLKSKTIEELYMRVVSNWSIDENLVNDSHFESVPLLSINTKLNELKDLEKMMLWDMQSYLMDDVLVKTDRAMMACSLEGRVPLLDHRIAQFAVNLPLEFKFKDGKGKLILREVLYKYVPKELIERPKKGFSLPLAEWLRGPLKEWAESLLDTKRVVAEGYLNSDLISRKWQEHLSGKRDWSIQLWSVLMFQLWLENQE